MTATTETMSRLRPLVDDLPLKPTSLVRLLPQPRDLLVNLADLVQTMALLLLLLPLDAVNDANAPERIGAADSCIYRKTDPLETDAPLLGSRGQLYLHKNQHEH